MLHGFIEVMRIFAYVAAIFGLVIILGIPAILNDHGVSGWITMPMAALFYIVAPIAGAAYALRKP